MSSGFRGTTGGSIAVAHGTQVTAQGKQTEIFAMKLMLWHTTRESGDETKALVVIFVQKRWCNQKSKGELQPQVRECKALNE